MKALKGLLILAVAVGALALPARAACPLADPADCIYVDIQACVDPGSGLQTDPFCSIQDALDFALDGDTVLVLPGTYLECVANVGINKSVDLLADAYLEDPVPSSRELTVLDGTAICDGTTIDPDTGFTRDEPVVLMGASNSTVEGFTVTGGGLSGIAARGGAVITNNIVRGNESVLGGGIYMYTASCDYPGDINAEISNNLIENNLSLAPTNDVNLEQSGDGGGVYVAAVGTVADADCFAGSVDVLIDGNIVQNNSVRNDNPDPASSGGAPYSVTGAGLVASTDSDPGSSARIVISQNTITGNGPAAGSESFGGGMWALTYGFGQETIEIRDNLVTSNSSTGDGGGISAWSDSFTLAEHVITVEDNAVANNSADGNGGGLDLFVLARDLDPGQVVSMSAQRNTIAGNDAAGFGGGGGGALLTSLAFRSTVDEISFDFSENDVRDNTADVSGGGVGMVIFADADSESDFSVNPPVCGTTRPASTTIDFVSNMVVDNTVVGITNPFPEDPSQVGGGVFAFTQAYGQATATANIDSSTLAGNGTDAGSGGIEIESLTDLDCVTLNEGSGEYLINNSIVANNEGFGIGGPPGGFAGVFTDGGGTNNQTVTVTVSDVFGNAGGDYERVDFQNPGGGNFGSDPMFYDEPIGDYRLSSASTALIDTGSAGAVLSLLDFEGDPRVFGSSIDIGADEFYDTDLDGTQNSVDNCPDDANADQSDRDDDLAGDVCDPCTDVDADGFGSPGSADCTAGVADEDCNDDSAADFPGAAEVCDGVDNDCNLLDDDLFCDDFDVDGDFEIGGAELAWLGRAFGLTDLTLPGNTWAQAVDYDGDGAIAGPDLSRLGSPGVWNCSGTVNVCD